MRWLIAWLFIISSCHFSPASHEEEQSLRVRVQNADVFERDVSHGLHLIIDAPKTTAAMLKKDLKLIPEPNDACVTASSGLASVVLAIKKTDSAYEISTRRKLIPKTIYGLYARNDVSPCARLLYTFRAQAPPRLQSHDLGSDVPKIVNANLRRIRLTFDQPIRLTADDAVHIVAQNTTEKAPHIETAMIDSDEKTLWLFLGRSPPLVAGHRYRLLFERSLQNHDGIATDEKPMDFVVVEALATPRDKTDVPKLYVGSRMLQFFWSLKHEHRVELFLVERATGKTLMATTGAKSLYDTLFNPHRLVVSKLQEKNDYDLIARAEDANGFVVVAKGVVRTAGEAGVRITELMINPHKKTTGQKAAEFIEITNASEKAIDLTSATIIIEDMASARETSCPLMSSLTLLPGEIAVIVAKTFDDGLYRLDEHIKLIRLDTKTLCGGLANQKPRRVRLTNADGFLLDSFDGLGWFAKKGMSISRASSTGLADIQKFCYSTPTPGKQNGPCG